MTKLTNVTPVEVTDPRTGETIKCCSRPIIDGPTLWTIFVDHLHGRMDMYQALTAVDGRRFDRRGQLSKADIGRARNVFRAIEKHGRESGVLCIPIYGRADAIDRYVEYLNRDRAAKDGKWARRADQAGREVAKYPRGKTAIRLADTNRNDDVNIILDAAKTSDQLSDTYEKRTNQFAQPIGMMTYQVKLARQRDAENAAAEKAHADRMGTATE